MKRWAVGFYNQYDNVLSVEIVYAETWWQAVNAHSETNGVEFEFDHDDLEKAKEDFFNADSGLDVVEIAP